MANTINGANNLPLDLSPVPAAAIKKPASATAAQPAQPAGGNGPSESAPPVDQTTLSSQGQMAARLSQALKAVPAFRPAVVGAIKQAVNRGSYQPDPLAVGAAVAKALGPVRR